jgi:hypothetical protein
MNLLRPLGGSDYDFLSKKYLVSINVEFANRLAEELGIRLDEYINLEFFNCV